MNSKKVVFDVRHMLLTTAIVGSLGLAGLPLSAAAQSANQSTNAVAAQAKQAALDAWHQSIRHIAPPTTGCFHVAYPSVIWEKVACGKASISHPVPSQKIIDGLLNKAGQASSKAGQNLLSGNDPLGMPVDSLNGNANGYSVLSSSLIQSATGSFPSVINVTSVDSSGALASQGTDGLGRYSIQLNTNAAVGNSPVCKNVPSGTAACQVWEQFAYQSDGSTFGGLLIQNWLYGWGLSLQAIQLAKTEQESLGISLENNPLMYPASCPAGWTIEYAGCMITTSTSYVPVIPISNLALVSLEGSATPNANDVALLTYGQNVYSVVEPDSTLGISSVWNQSDFNVLGANGASEANFNPGASITVKLQINDGTGVTPTLLGPSGLFVDETNNLTLGQGTVTGPAIVPTATGFSLANPYIQYTESN